MNWNLRGRKRSWLIMVIWHMLEGQRKLLIDAIVTVVGLSGRDWNPIPTDCEAVVPVIWP
jgi:hypothetical protein